MKENFVLLRPAKCHEEAVQQKQKQKARVDQENVFQLSSFVVVVVIVVVVVVVAVFVQLGGL